MVSEGGSSDTTASGQSGAPSTEGKELSDPLVIAQQADETTVERNTAEQENDQGVSPAGGSPGDEKSNEDEQLTVFEIVRDVVQNNPLTVALISVIALGILGLAGYRRDKKHMGEM